MSLAACASDQAETQTPADEPASQSAGTVNPNAVKWTAMDIDGNTRSWDEWIGKRPVVINFWGTWCGPCRREIPELVRLYDEYKDKGVEIISIALRDTPNQVRAYSQQNNMGWVMLMGGDQQMLVDYRFGGGVPTTIFLDRTGTEVGRFVGPRDYRTFKQAFDAILNSAG